MRYKALAVTAAAVGTIALGAAPATAAEKWDPVSTNSTWECGDYENHVVSNNVSFKTCVVHNASGDAQTVLVVQNRASVAVAIEGWLKFEGAGSEYTVFCDPSPLNPGYTRGCYGPSVQVGSAVAKGMTQLELNGVWDTYSRYVYN
jgi:hypothetical protein